MKSKIDYIDSVEEICAMPGIALDVMGLINEPTTTTQDLTKKIKLDEALAVFILRNCNSPLYGIREQINAIPRAINLLGFTVIKSILMQYFNRNLYNLSGKDDIKKMLWEHSIYVASFSQTIASYLKMDPEEAYLSGLLHDVGKLVMYSYDAEKFREVIKEIQTTSQASYFLEEKIMGFSHMEVATFLFEKWKFSDNLKEVATHHHAGQFYKGNNQCVPVVAFADLLVHREVYNNQIDDEYYMKYFKFSDLGVNQIVKNGHKLTEEYLELLA